MMRALVQLLRFFVLSAALGAAILFYQAPNLAGINRAASEGLEPENLADTVSQVVIKQAGKQTLGEGDINAFLASSIASRQSGLSMSFATPEEVVCDLKADRAALHLCWSVFGHRVHASADFTVARQGKELVFDLTGGSYGRLAVPRYCLGPLRPALQGLVTACQPEIQALLSLPKLSIVNEKLVLDPAF